MFPWILSRQPLIFLEKSKKRQLFLTRISQYDKLKNIIRILQEYEKRTYTTLKRVSSEVKMWIR
jgi:hypothetical protein